MLAIRTKPVETLLFRSELDAIAPFDPAVCDRPAKPFPFAAGPSDARSYLAAHALRAVASFADGADGVR